MATLHHKLAASTLSLTILTGCTPTTPNQPTTQPSPTCTPETGGNPYPCTQYQHDQMTAKNKLYTQAETVYRKFLAEDERINRAGGVTKPTPVLLETTTGEYLNNAMAIYRELHRIHASASGGTYRIAWIKRVPGEAMNGSIIALQSCVDASTIRMGAKGTPPRPGLINQLTGYFAQVGPTLKITASQFEKVSKC